EVAPPVGRERADQRDVGLDGVLENIRASVDHALLFAVSERGSDSRGREESADAGTRRANALGEVALGYELELDLSRTVEAVEHPRIRLPRERADDPAHASRREQRGQPDVTVPRVVVHDSEVAGTALDQRVDQLNRLSGTAEAADHH